jgi:cell division protein DivIC
MTSAIKRRLLIFGSASIFIILMAIITINNYFINYFDLRSKHKILQEQLLLLKENEDDLKIELQKLKDPEYIARYARENYLYSKDGEYIIKIERTKTTESTTKEEDNYYGYLWFLAPVGAYLYIKRRRYKNKKKDLDN